MVMERGREGEAAKRQMPVVKAQPKDYIGQRELFQALPDRVE